MIINPLFIAGTAYLVAMNLYTLVLMRIDKKRAVKKKRRIPEARFFATALIGGSIGAIFGMYAFRHKTKHLRFIIGLPIILLMQICALLALHLLLR
ncbi:MAG: DUF1294 domain-containing protein [Clostridiales bacterium]|jgi:uncharacterized membrane protein YsdA (DUF1294 family)|nr:DUF1294 domain-containing protein [Clostridiales bacterium]